MLKTFKWMNTQIAKQTQFAFIYFVTTLYFIKMVASAMHILWKHTYMPHLLGYENWEEGMYSTSLNIYINYVHSPKFWIVPKFLSTHVKKKKKKQQLRSKRPHTTNFVHSGGSHLPLILHTTVVLPHVGFPHIKACHMCTISSSHNYIMWLYFIKYLI